LPITIEPILLTCLTKYIVLEVFTGNSRDILPQALVLSATSILSMKMG